MSARAREVMKDVKDLVSREAASMQNQARDRVRQAIEQARWMLKRGEVAGEHRKQLEHALQLSIEAEDFLGNVMDEAA